MKDEHKSAEVIKIELEKAINQVMVGKLYKHYKNPELSYKVLNLAIQEANDEICVIYQAQYDDKLIFVRPLSSWLDDVEWESTKVKRFRLVNNS